MLNIISIPHGTIKSQQALDNMEWFPVISIPHGTIKSIPNFPTFIFPVISIPHGTIKRRTFIAGEYAPDHISIPHGTIKSTNTNGLESIKANFNTSWYN